MSDTIIIGSRATPLWTLTAGDVRTVRAVLSSSIVGDELAVDTLKATICSTVGVGFHPPVAYGTPVYWMRGGTLLGKFYCRQVLRKSKDDYQLTAVSAVGVLDKQTHYGGIYTGQTFAQVAADILGPSFSFQSTDDLGKQQVYGWLPVASRRQNLHQLLFAMGAQIAKDADGELFFQYPDTTEKEIPDERIYYDGEISYNTNANRVELTEHSFYALASDEQVTLFDNVTGGGARVSHLRVVFQDAPVHDLAATSGLTIEESGVNFAVLSGSGVLTGKKYTHTTQLLVDTTDGETIEEQTVSIPDCTLVNVANSENTLQRLLDYYGSARSISTAIVVDGEKTGQMVRFTNPALEEETAFIAEMNLNSSAILKGNCVMVADYIPTGGGNNFNNYKLLTASGSWTVPAGVRMIRIILGGAGQGGGSGYKGADGNRKSYSYSKTVLSHTTTYRGTQYGEPAKGGAPGEPGVGGKVLILTLRVQPGQVLQFTRGAAGAGGAYIDSGSTPGAFGTESSVSINGNTYSSADGTRSEAGYYDAFTGRTFSLPGKAGVKGGDSAGLRPGVDPTSSDALVPTPAEDVVGPDGTVYHGGDYRKLPPPEGRVYFEFSDSSYGGDTVEAVTSVALGSGAAVGSDGAYGGDTPGTHSASHSTRGFSLTAVGAAGVNGADATVIPTTASTPGCGGNAGHGGGAGGGPGIQETSSTDGATIRSETSTPGAVGVGGKGTRGGNAAPGYLLIYY